jgi:DHA1 family tetracycline resistance protein-like MFS transporter
MRRQAAIGFILVTALLDIVAMGMVIPVLPSLIEDFSGTASRAGIWNGVLVVGLLDMVVQGCSWRRW